MLYVLTNLEEVTPYMEQFLHEFWHRSRDPTPQEYDTLRKTTCSGVFTPGLDDVDYFGQIEEIYELNFYGSKPLTPVIFKCHWFDPQVTRRTHSNLGIIEI
jgi:hypothetical protein